MVFDIKPGRGSERVKAWVYAIMNPLIDSLRRETELLKTGNLSWRLHTRCCEYIRPVAELIDTAQRPNLQDFLAENPTFRALFADHDSAVVEVEQATTIFVRELLSSPTFQALVAKCLDTYESAVRASNPTYPDLSEIRSRVPDYIAEFIVNNTRSLPAHYIMYPFWMAFSGEFEALFLSFRQSAAAKAAQKLLTMSEPLTVDLESLRLALCREYDIPAAPIEPPRISSVENVLFR